MLPAQCPPMRIVGTIADSVLQVARQIRDTATEASITDAIKTYLLSCLVDRLLRIASFRSLCFSSIVEGSRLALETLRDSLGGKLTVIESKIASQPGNRLLNF